jgi:hypothetical protein
MFLISKLSWNFTKLHVMSYYHVLLMTNRHCVARLNTRYVPEGSFCVARMVCRNVEAHPADLILEVDLVRGSRPSEGDIGIEHLVLVVEMSNQVQLAVEHDFHENRVADTQDMQDIGHVLLDRVPPLLASVLVP